MTEYEQYMTETVYGISNSLINVENSMASLQTSLDAVSASVSDIQAAVAVFLASNPNIVNNLSYVSDCLRVLAGLVEFIVIIIVCKYCYKFINMFFPDWRF